MINLKNLEKHIRCGSDSPPFVGRSIDFGRRGTKKGSYIFLDCKTDRLKPPSDIQLDKWTQGCIGVRNTKLSNFYCI